MNAKSADSNQTDECEGIACDLLDGVMNDVERSLNELFGYARMLGVDLEKVRLEVEAMLAKELQEENRRLNG